VALYHPPVIFFVSMNTPRATEQGHLNPFI
jgi:hypothetical protein